MTDSRYFILGTAGHVDHGKTTLIKALTGIETDRLPEEKARGLSIDLGFAHLALPSKRVAGIVDVPGHERFLKNMLAGVGGFDMVMLVVDAVESIMPQTREHMEILEQLKIPAGVVALTKADLVDEEFLQMALEEVREYLADTFLANAPIVPVSGTTGFGTRKLLKAIDTVLDTVPPRVLDAPAYLPVDRVFVKAGFGTVVTGSLWTGRLRKGDRVAVMPDGGEAKVRGIQVYGETSEEALAGQRVAVNLGGVDAERVRRGQVVGSPEALVSTARVDANVALHKGARPLRNRARVRLYFATCEALGKAVILDADEIAPGESGLVQFLLDEPITSRRGDRFVLRNSTAEQTIGGGLFLEMRPEAHRRKDEKTLEILRQQEEGTALNLVKAVLMQAPLKPRRPSDVAESLKNPLDIVTLWLHELEDAGEVTTIQEGRLVLLSSAFDNLREKARALFARLEESAPWRTGFKPDEVSRLLFERTGRDNLEMLNALVEHGVLKQVRGLLSSPDHHPRVPSPYDKALERFLAETKKNELATPAWADVQAGFGFDGKTWGVLRDYLTESGEVVFLAPDVWLLSSTIDDARRRLAAFVKANGPFTPAQARDLLGTTRKYIIPLLEYFDNTKVTRRDGDSRVMA